MTKHIRGLFLLISFLALVGPSVRAQSQADVDAYMDLLRSDLRARKAVLIREQLPLSKTEADAFGRFINGTK